MSSKTEKLITEEDLCKFLENESKRKEWAHTYLETLGPEGIRLLSERILKECSAQSKTRNTELANLLGIKTYSSTEKKTLEMNSLFNYFQHRRLLLSNSIGAVEAAEMLGVSKQTIHDRIREGKLIGIIDANVMKLPIFQFDPEGPNGVVSGLSEVLKEMNGNMLGKISWLISKNMILENKSPIEILKSGDIKRVLSEARSAGVA